jgi:hypothetical protein
MRLASAGMTTDSLVHRAGVPVLALDSGGPPLRDERDVTDLVGAAYGHGAELVLVPVERLPDEFFALRTGLAGMLAQKLVNYRLRVAVAGDVSARVAASTALRDFVTEANRGNQMWFVATVDELEERLRHRVQR